AKPEVPKPETYRPPYPEAKPPVVEAPRPEPSKPPYLEAKPPVVEAPLAVPEPVKPPEEIDIFAPPPERAEPSPAAAPPPKEVELPPPPKVQIGGWLMEEAGLLPTRPHLGPPGPGVTEREELPLELPPGGIEEQPSRRRREEEVIEYYGKKRDYLNRRIDELYEVVPRELSDEEMANALAHLSKARDILAEKPRQFDQAEYLVARAEAIVERRRRIRYSSNTWGLLILMYALGWFLALFGGFLFGQNIITWVLRTAQLTQAEVMSFYAPFWSALMWGGIGGVVGALYSLHWHVADRQDFEQQFTMWYIVQPIMGVILGGIVYLLVGVGFLNLQIVGEPTSPAVTAIRFFPSLLACIAGFRQNLVYELIEMLIKRLTPEIKKEKAQAEQVEELTTPPEEGRATA
ncbi:MAG: hypothetical protein ACUVV0_10690, partial [Anaerolineae bacterium]